MNILGLSISRTKAISSQTPLTPLSSRGGWWSIIREPFAGAWQSNQEIKLDNVLTYFAVYACLRLISTDMGKMGVHLSEQDDNGIWEETDSAAFSPVLRVPNRYQTFNKYVEQYILSKLIHGNAYVLMDRDGRGVVTALYVLNPTRVTPLVAFDGSVYYQLMRDDLSGLPKDVDTVPASEIIHDTMIAPWHPLIGLSPLYASGLAAMQGLSIQSESTTFFQNRSTPNGVLTAPVGITNDQAEALKATWKARKSGDIAVLAGDLKYQPLSMTAVDAQLIDQLKWGAENVCSTFGVPPYLVDIGPPPPYANFEPLLLKYHSQCIQSLVTNFETSHEKGLGLTQRISGKQYGVELDIDDLIWMDTMTKADAAGKAITSGLSYNEVRKRFYGKGPVKGGESPLSQQQNYSLEALAKRDAGDPFAVTAPERITGAAPAPVDAVPSDGTNPAKFARAMRAKCLEHELYAAA